MAEQKITANDVQKVVEESEAFAKQLEDVNEYLTQNPDDENALEVELSCISNCH